MNVHPDVLILGGGVIGLTTAHYLAAAGARVVVVEQGDFGRQASWAGAGIIPPGNLERAATPYDRLRALSSALYPVLSQELRRLSGVNNGYVVCGGVHLELADEPVPTDEWIDEGIGFTEVAPGGESRLDADLPPWPGRVFHLPGLAQVRNPRHLHALVSACLNRDVLLQPHVAARQLERRGSRLVAVRTDKDRLTADRYLIAAGAWSDDLLASVGWRPGIRPVRGQIALLNTGKQGVRPVIEVGRRYLVPRPDGLVLVGSTEEDAGFDARPTAEAIAELLRFAQTVRPDLSRATPEKCWAGLRPGSPDGLPFLGPVPGVDNLFVAAGHFRAGIQLSPGTGQCLAALLLGQTPPLPLDAFRLDRPPAAPVQTAFRS
jgi:glycine oxidase